MRNKRYPVKIKISYNDRDYEITKFPVPSLDGFLYFHHKNNNFSQFLQFTHKEFELVEWGKTLVFKNEEKVLCFAELDKLKKIELKGVGAYTGGLNKKISFENYDVRVFSNSKSSVSFKGENSSITFSCIDSLNII